MIIPALKEMGDSGVTLKKRSTWICDEYGDHCYQASSWNNWGRWLALVVFIGAFFFFFFLFAWIAARRRRLNQHTGPGNSWYAPTSWFAPKPPAGANQNPNQWSYDPYTNNVQPPAPPYSPPMNGYFRPQPQSQQYEMQDAPQHGQSGPQETGQYSVPRPASPPPAHVNTTKI